MQIILKTWNVNYNLSNHQYGSIHPRTNAREFPLSCKRSVVVRILTNLTYGGRVCASLLLLRLALLSHGPVYRCSERSRDTTGYNCKLLQQTQAITTVRIEKYAKQRNNATSRLVLFPPTEGLGTRLSCSRLLPSILCKRAGNAVFCTG